MGLEVRFTCKGEKLYAILLGTPQEKRLVLRQVRLSPGGTVRLLGHASPLSWAQAGPDLRIDLAEPLPEEPAHVFELTYPARTGLPRGGSP